MEKHIHRLLEQSAQLLREEPFLALEKAKEAVKKNTQLVKYRDANSFPGRQGNDMSFASYFHLAIVYEKNGMYLDALDTYSNLLKQKQYEHCSVRIRSNMGNVYYSQKNFTQAIKMYRMALDQTTSRDEKPLRFHLHRSIGNIFVKIGKLRDAILDYEAVSMSADADVETCFNLLLCYAHIGDLEKSKSTFLKILSVLNVSKNKRLRTMRPYTTGADESETELEIQHDQDKRGKGSTDLFLTAARLLCSMDHGDDWKVGYRWVQDQVREKNCDILQQIEMEQAIQYLRRNEFKSAIKMLKSFESKDVDLRAMVATNLSFVYSLEGKHAVADDFTDIALASNRFNPNALVNKGNSLYMVENYTEAKELYLEAVGVDSTKFEAIFNLGMVNVKLGLAEEAEQAFGKLHSFITNDPRVLYHVANLYDESGDSESALKWFNVLSARLPSDPAVQFRIGNLYADQDKNSQCLHYCLESHRLYPSNLNVIGWLAVWFVKHEMYEKSIHFFRKAAQIQPNEVKWDSMITSCLRRMDTDDNDSFVMSGK